MKFIVSTLTLASCLAVGMAQGGNVYGPKAGQDSKVSALNGRGTGV